MTKIYLGELVCELILRVFLYYFHDLICVLFHISSLFNDFKLYDLLIYTHIGQRFRLELFFFLYYLIRLHDRVTDLFLIITCLCILLLSVDFRSLSGSLSERPFGLFSTLRCTTAAHHHLRLL